MKRFFALLLCLTLFAVPAIAAEIDLSALDADQLQTVINDASQRLRDARAVKSDGAFSFPLTFSGDGTDIVTGVELAGNIPFRVTYAQEGTSDFEVSYLLNGDDRSLLRSPTAQSFVSKPGTYDFIVESEGPWSISIEPLSDGGVLDVSGTGAAVTDVFTISGPTIIEFTANKGSAWHIGLISHTVSDRYSDSDVLVNELSGEGKEFSAKKVLKFATETRVFFELQSITGDWSIKAIGK